MKYKRKSCGVILVTSDKKILVCKKADTYGLLDFLRGNWILPSDALSLLSKTTKEERQKLNVVHIQEMCKIYNADYKNLLTKFNGENPQNFIKRLLLKCPDYRGDFEFPKGRIIQGEADISCALREFSEETGICTNFLTENIISLTIKENIIDGLNVYPVVYFLIRYPFISEKIDVTKFCRKEVAKLLWIDKNNVSDFLSPGKVLIVNHVLDFINLCVR